MYNEKEKLATEDQQNRKNIDNSSKSNNKLKKQKQNSFDILFESLQSAFSQIPNFELAQTDIVINHVVTQIVYRITDISAYKNLVVNSYIPATNKAIVEARNDIKQSKYRKQLNENDINFKDTIHETIRLSYVGLFHKFENFVYDVIEFMNLSLKEIYEVEGDIRIWANEKFDFKFHDWQLFSEVHKVNWISNCVKHKDGFPIKENPPKKLTSLDKNIKMELTKEDFVIDSQRLIEFYPNYLKIIFNFVHHMVLTKELENEEFQIQNPEKSNEIKIKLENFEELIKKQLLILKEL